MHREYIMLSAHFYGNVQHIGVGRHSIRSPTRFSQDLRSGQVDVEAHVFYYVIKIFKQKKSPYRVSKGTIVIFMKKYVLMLMSLFMMVCSANAQLKDDIQKSKERAAKLQALCNDYKTSGSANVDGYGDAVKNAAVLAIANSVQLENMYKRQIGETQDGVTDVTITKPTLDEWVTFAATVAGEAASIKAATDKVQAAADEAKKMTEEASKQKNPMKAAKAAKTAKAATAVVEFGNTATLILVEESAAQVKAVNTIIETLKSGKNL